MLYLLFCLQTTVPTSDQAAGAAVGVLCFMVFVIGGIGLLAALLGGTTSNSTSRTIHHIKDESRQKIDSASEEFLNAIRNKTRR